MSSVHAMACTHCREKKLRCGRERPRCTNCMRDSVDCAYSTPGKRVNHVKLLCDSVGDVIDRLNNVEGELSRLNVLLKTGSNQNPSADDISPWSPSDEQPSKNLPVRSMTDRHTIRSQGDLMDRYHGPCSLLAMCNEFRNFMFSEKQDINITGPDRNLDNNWKNVDSNEHNDTIRAVLSRLCVEASLEESFDIQSDPVPIRLPPKQFLLMTQTQFFQQAGYTTDLFVQSSFWTNVEQLYSRPYKPGDEAWAICFNTIILLVLGSESATQNNNDPIIGSQFALPFLMTVKTALGNLRLLMAPKLINVQALALLCIASQQYYSTGLSESIFAQACMLARTMGLHHTQIAPEGISPEEQEERHKVFMSLYLRDKSFSISRSSLCWLPSFDCTLPLNSGQTNFADPTCVARIQLARLQEDIYQSFYSAESQTQSLNKRNSALSRIDQCLKHWAHINEVTSLPLTTSYNVDLLLEFLAARISAFWVSRDPDRIRQTLDSARASCVLLLVAYGKQDKPMMEQLEKILLPDTSSRNLDKAISVRSGQSEEDCSDFDSSKTKFGSPNLRSLSLLDTFSIPGIFELVRNILNIDTIDFAIEVQAEEDLNLLRRVYTCFEETDEKEQQSHGSLKIFRVLQGLLEIASLVGKPTISPITQTVSSQSGTSIHNTPESQDFPDELSGVSDFSSLLASCSPPTTSLPWSMSMNPRATTIDGGFPSLVLPFDSRSNSVMLDYLGQPQMSPPEVQRPGPVSRGWKRPYENDGDFVMENGSNLTSLSELLFVAPDSNLDIMS